MADEKQDEKKGKTKDVDLIAEACKAYGIAPKYVFASCIDELTGEAVIVTHGGKKVRYKSGVEVEKLNDIAITGINPAAAKRKPIAGKPKE